MEKSRKTDTSENVSNAAGQPSVLAELAQLSSIAIATFSVS